MAENISNKSDDYKNDRINPIVLGLFALIGFIILVYSIFTGVVGESLASIANSVFLAAIIGSFTLVGAIIGHMSKK